VGGLRARFEASRLITIRQIKMLEVSASGWRGTQQCLPAGGGLRPTRLLRGFFLGVGQVLFVGALEVFDFAAFEMPNAGGDFVDDVVVVSY